MSRERVEESGILNPSSPEVKKSLSEPWSVQQGDYIFARLLRWFRLIRTALTALSKFSSPLLSAAPSKSPIQFFHLLERLKTTPREGWRRFNITRGESISDHMYRMSIMTMLAPTSLSARLDIPHCTRMALIHDMAESLVGDITPVDGVSKEEKCRRETEAMDYISTHLLGSVGSGGAEAGATLRRVWQEYEDNQTEEAKFVHDIDKLELILQMVEYEKSNEGRIDLGEFSWVANRIVFREMQVWCVEVLQEREEFWKGRDKGTEKIRGLDIGRQVIDRGLTAKQP